LQVLEWDLSPNTAHLWLTTLYQASFSQHVSQVQRLEFKPTITDTPKSPSSLSHCSVTLLPDSSHLCEKTSTSWCHSVVVPITPSREDEDSENTRESWLPRATVCTIHNMADHSNGCSECFLSAAQFSQNEFIQIVRVWIFYFIWMLNSCAFNYFSGKCLYTYGIIILCCFQFSQSYCWKISRLRVVTCITLNILFM